MSWIGLTGGIAAGKSAVAQRLAEHGAVIIDADVVAREVVEPGTPGLARIVEEFGPEVVDADGRLIRPALGAIVFSDPAKRVVLEGITHPAIRERTRALRDAALAADPDAVVVNDVPLLVESRGREHGFDEVIVVHAPAEERIRRMVELRGMDRAEAERRIAAQASDEERLAVATTVIDASGTLAQTLAQVDEWWAAHRG
ncbi:hypothetical protein GCM10027515_21940 [Schumannella luteola]|uniref:Dephospho-CoA kinase n=1 Tax=Schumannella luteola TaxID=472059 RepID=A0A852YFD6_9MICO|nr:dephospho-CoA kinase [Schumannella luteola]TPX05450.1 dephospho-CoA kinase [Schumannella luteola]